MNDNTLQIILAIISIIGVLMTSVLVPFIKSKTTAAQQQQIDSIVWLVVRAIEQIFDSQPGANEQKKEAALKAATQFLKNKGISVSPEQLSTIIEASVYQLNRAKESAVSGSVETKPPENI